MIRELGQLLELKQQWLESLPEQKRYNSFFPNLVIREDSLIFETPVFGQYQSDFELYITETTNKPGTLPNLEVGRLSVITVQRRRVMKIFDLPIFREECSLRWEGNDYTAEYSASFKDRVRRSNDRQISLQSINESQQQRLCVAFAYPMKLLLGQIGLHHN